jgi:hypothetical protein
VIEVNSDQGTVNSDRGDLAPKITPITQITQTTPIT